MAAADTGRPRQPQRGTPECAAPVVAGPHAHLHAVRPVGGTPRVTWRRGTAVSDLPDLIGPLSPALIRASVPRRMRRSPDQRTFLRELKQDADVLALRSDGYAHLMLICTLIAWRMNWETKCSRPTIAWLVERSGLSKPTVKRWVRWLRERGWLGVVEQGSTCRYRKGTMAGLVDDGLGHRAAVWVLCVPRPIRDPRDQLRDQGPCKAADQPEQISEPPSRSLRRRELDPTRTREERSPARRVKPRISPQWGLHQTPRTKRDRLAMCERLRRESPVLGLMTPWYLRWLLKPFIDAGATASDVLHALDVREDDSRWSYTWRSRDEIRHPAGWVRHRLSAWLGPDGRVLPLPSHRRAAADARRRAEQEARRREWERIAAAASRVPAPRPATDVEEPAAAVAGLETVAPVAAEAVGPNAAFRAAREELERRRREREAAELAMLAVRGWGSS
ncbi:hypothetical protein EJK15_54935 [Nonomuraea basaltis]|nr:hypothetical protein EJK15_54935 [Nonomuraea basaltis]